MSPKPHRLLLDRVSGYADEASAYLRRRRTALQPFARVWCDGDRSAAVASETEKGRALFLSAAALIDAAGPSPSTPRSRGD